MHYPIMFPYVLHWSHVFGGISHFQTQHCRINPKCFLSFKWGFSIASFDFQRVAESLDLQSEMLHLNITQFRESSPMMFKIRQALTRPPRCSCAISAVPAMPHRGSCRPSVGIVFPSLFQPEDVAAPSRKGLSLLLIIAIQCDESMYIYSIKCTIWL